MTNDGAHLFRMKSNCVVSGVPWWQEGGVYSGHSGSGSVGTVRLMAPDGVDSLEVLRGSVVRLDEFATRQ